MDEPWFQKMEREAVERMAALLALPMPDERGDIGCVDMFDPWELFPLYGSYSSDFDEMAIEVLEELAANKKNRSDLAAEMFREMLCKMHLCDYGTSPRVCFPSQGFKPLLPKLIEQWKAYSALQWQEDE